MPTGSTSTSWTATSCPTSRSAGRPSRPSAAVTELPFDAHLMISEPGRWTRAVPRRRLRLDHVPRRGRRAAGPAGAGADPRGRPGGRACRSSPRRRWRRSTPYRDLLDIVLVMTVEPGFGGQAFMADVADAKLASRRATWLDPGGACEVQLDGGGQGRDRRGHRARRDRRHRRGVGALARRRHGGRGRADPLDRRRGPRRRRCAASPADGRARARAAAAGQPRRGPRGRRRSSARSGPACWSCSASGHGRRRGDRRRAGAPDRASCGSSRTTRAGRTARCSTSAARRWSSASSRSTRTRAAGAGPGSRTPRRRTLARALWLRFARRDRGAGRRGRRWASSARRWQVELVNDGPFTIWLDTADR